MPRRPIAPVDTIWLNMDRPDNLMVIESLMTLDGPLDRDRFLAMIQRRVLDLYPVFSQVPVPSRLPLVAPHWEDDPHFDLERHVRRVVLPPPGDDSALREYVDAHLGVPLRRDRPLWEMHLIEGYDGDRSAVYSRLHHSLADGIALMRVLLSMTDAAADDDLLEEPAPEESGPGGLLASSAHLAGTATSALLDAGRLLTPGHLGDAVTLARQTAGISAKLLLTKSPHTPATGMPDVRKRAIWAPPIPLENITETARRTGTTVNDVLVAALAGALSTYLRRHHGEAVDMPTMVPVNVRPVDKPLPRELGNRFALVLFILPSGLDTPFQRLAETKRRMDAIKHSPEAVLTFGLIEGIGRTGPDLERVVVDFFANKAIGVTTNVPGPREPRYLAGTRVVAILGWVPESGRQTLGTSIFSYDGSVFVGFKADTSVVKDPEDLMRAFLDEVDALCRLGGSAYEHQQA